MKNKENFKFRVKAEHRDGEGDEVRYFFKLENAKEYFEFLKETGQSCVVSSEITGEPLGLIFVQLNENDNILDSYYFKKYSEKELLNRHLPNEF